MRDGERSPVGELRHHHGVRRPSFAEVHHPLRRRGAEVRAGAEPREHLAEAVGIERGLVLAPLAEGRGENLPAFELPFIEELAVHPWRRHDEKPASKRDKPRERVARLVGKPPDAGEHDCGKPAEAAAPAGGRHVLDNCLEKEFPALRLSRESRHLGTERKPRVSCGALHQRCARAAFYEKDPQAVENRHRVLVDIVGGQVIARVDLRRDDCAAGLLEAVRERKSLRFAWLQLPQVVRLLHFAFGRERHALRRHGLGTGIDNRDLEIHFAVGADNVPRRAHGADGEVSHGGGKRQCAPRDYRLGLERREDAPYGLPALLVLKLPSDGLAVSDDDNLLDGVVACGESDRRRSEVARDLHGAVRNVEAVERREDHALVCDRHGVHHLRNGAADDHGERRVARGKLDVLLRLLYRALEV